MNHLTNRQVMVLGVLLTGLGAMFSPLQGVAQPPESQPTVEGSEPLLSETPQPLATPPASSGKSTRAVGTITGQGTAGNIAKFTGPNAIGNSVIFENAGKVGIGLTTPAGLLSVKGTAANVYPLYVLNASAGNALLSSSNGGVGVYGTHTDTSGDFSGVLGDTNSTSANAAGILGTIKSTAPGSASAGVRGINKGTNANGYGVYGSQAGGGSGVYGNAPTGNGVLGESVSGVGVYGRNTGTSGATPGVLGETNSTSSSAIGVQGIVNTTSPGGYSAGVRGINNGTGGSGIGVYGSQAGSGYGIYGISQNGSGVVGTTVNSGYGVYGSSSGGFGVFGTSSSGYGMYGTSTSKSGVYGISSSESGVKGFSSSNYGVSGESSSKNGVYGLSDASNGAGVQGKGYIGVQGNTNGTSAGSQAIRGDNGGSNTNGYAGYFSGRVVVAGNLNVTGTLTKGAGSFKIDHPLHPATEYLSHSFVESPDMMNVYNGNTTLNSKGEAIIMLPGYFQSLNRDFRYQLTCIGAPALIYVAKKISNNRFKIAGGKAGMEVSWQVTGIRNDAYARQHRIRVEETKTGADRGCYLYPAGFGAGRDRQIGPDEARLAAR